MKKTVIIYGSSTGTCEELAHTIADQLSIDKTDIYSVDKLSENLINQYDVLILGTSTWGDGELQDDWYDGIKILKAANLTQKSIALFGCGDSASYPDTFCDGMGLLYEDLKDSGCHFLGNNVSASNYSFSSSIAENNGNFVGLALDEVNESNLTPQRITNWIDSFKNELKN